MQHIAHSQDQDRQNDQAPQNAQDDTERRVTDKGEQVRASLVSGIGQYGLADAAEVTRRKAVVAPAQSREFGNSDTTSGPNNQRLDEALEEDQRHPQTRILSLQASGQQIPMTRQGVKAGVGNTAD